MPINRTTRNVALILALAAPGIGIAADSGWYAGGDIGQSDFNLKLPGGYTLSGTGAAESRSSTAYNLFGGYDFNRYVALEAGYMDLGKYSVTANGKTGTAKIDGFNLGALWKLPLNDQWTVFARTGILAARANAHADAANYDESASSTVAVLGLGVSYAFSKELDIRLQYQDIGAAKVLEAVGQTVKMNVDLWSVGLTYRF